jgi:23S rRNA A2030 N6-methylase RlmJ
MAARHEQSWKRPQAVSSPGFRTLMARYSHDTRAGNQGDVAKHSAFLEVLRHVTAETDTARFWYVDVHAAGPIHDLPKDGSWEKGVGSIPAGSLQSYIDSVFHCDSGHGNRYLGSSAMVYKWFRERGHQPPSMTLFDIDISVCHDLFEYYAARHEADPVLMSAMSGSPEQLLRVWNALEEDGKLMIVHGDGYRLTPHLLASEIRPNLALIDPPKVEVKKRKKGMRKWLECFPFVLLEQLEEARVPFMCWTPINALGDPKTAKNLTPPTRCMLTECRRKSSFRTMAICWGRKGGMNQTKGCQLTFFHSISQKALVALAAELRKMPGWDVEIASSTRSRQTRASS